MRVSGLMAKSALLGGLAQDAAGDGDLGGRHLDDRPGKRLVVLRFALGIVGVGRIIWISRCWRLPVPSPPSRTAPPQRSAKSRNGAALLHHKPTRLGGTGVGIKLASFGAQPYKTSTDGTDSAFAPRQSRSNRLPGSSPLRISHRLCPRTATAGNPCPAGFGRR